MPFWLDAIIKLALAGIFSGMCAYAYLRLARNRRNVKREALLVLGSLFLFTVIRLLAIG